MDETTNNDELELLMYEAEKAAAEAAKAAEEADDQTGAAGEPEPAEAAEPADAQVGADTEADATVSAGEEPEPMQPQGLTGFHGLVEAARDTDADDEETRNDRPEVKPPQVIFTLLILLLLALPALGLAIGNGYIAIPALRGMFLETQKHLISAQAAYGEVNERAVKAEAKRVKLFSVKNVNGSEKQAAQGLSVGSFTAERIALMQHKANGPFVSAEFVSSFTQGGARVPRRIAPLVAEYEDLKTFDTDINSSFNEAYTKAMPEDAEELDEAKIIAALLDAMEAYRKTDKDAAKHAPYYDYYTCSLLARNPEKLKPRVAEMKKADRESWVYEDMEYYAALQAKDYANAAQINRNRLARNKEDSNALRELARALWLAGKKDEAQSVTDAKQPTEIMRDSAKLAKAEFLYREKKYTEAIAICDAIIKVTRAAPETDATRGAREVEALATKAIVLMLQEKTVDASKMLKTAMDREYVPQNMSAALAYAALAASYEADTDFYQALVTSFFTDNTGQPRIPQDVQSLLLGETTVADLYQKGWGVTM